MDIKEPQLNKLTQIRASKWSAYLIATFNGV